MGKTTIQWTDQSANPIRARHKATGKVGWHCVMCSPGCANCYSHTLNGRFGTQLPYNKRSEEDVELFLDLKPMERLYRSRKPAKVFLCDMTDLFADFVPFEWVDRIFEIISVSVQHEFQVLTKRPERMLEYFRGGRPALGNVWLGVSCEDQQRADERIPALLQIPAAVRFLSVEPLIGPVSLHSPECRETGDADRCVACFGTNRDMGGIDWVIVGGESGHGARPCDLAWIRSIRDQCRAAGVSCFIKQLGSNCQGYWLDPNAPGDGICHHSPDRGWKLRDKKGGEENEWPHDLRGLREFPTPRVEAIA